MGGDPNRRRTDFEKFLGYAPKVPFNKPRYFQWRLYWDYSGGISTDLLVHQTDAIHMIVGRHYCKSVMCNGGIHAWTEDDREVPDTITAGFEYDGYFHINYSVAFSNMHFGYGEELLGTEGTMIISQLSDLHVYPEKLKALGTKVTSCPEMHFNAQKDFGQGNPTNEHLKNFIDAVKSDVPRNCPVELGHEAAVTGHLATSPYATNRTTGTRSAGSTGSHKRGHRVQIRPNAELNWPEVQTCPQFPQFPAIIPHGLAEPLLPTACDGVNRPARNQFEDVPDFPDEYGEPKSSATPNNPNTALPTSLKPPKDDS